MTGSLPFYLAHLARQYSGDYDEGTQETPETPEVEQVAGTTNPLALAAPVIPAAVRLLGAYSGPQMGLARPEPTANSVTAPTGEPRNVAPAIAAAAPAEVSPLFTDPEWTAMGEQKRAAEYRSPMRAIRMPDGKLLFTNREEYGGEELSTKDAGRLVRQGDRSSLGPLPIPRTPLLDPTSTTMSALVRASARAAQARGEGGMPAPTGRMVEGTTPDVSGGAASFIEGTPEQRSAIDLDRARAALSLAQTRQSEEIARMPAAQAAMLGNKDLQTASFLLNRFLPEIQRVQAVAAEKVRLIRASVTDPRAQQAQLVQIEQDAADQVRTLQNVMSVLMGVRPGPS